MSRLLTPQKYLNAPIKVKLTICFAAGNIKLNHDTVYHNNHISHKISFGSCSKLNSTVGLVSCY